MNANKAKNDIRKFKIIVGPKMPRFRDDPFLKGRQKNQKNFMRNMDFQSSRHKAKFLLLAILPSKYKKIF
jgi:hypothetical protein